MIALTLLFACTGAPSDSSQPDDTAPDVVIDTADGVSFDEIAPIFEARCSPCHVGTLAPVADLSLDHPATVVDVPHVESGLDLVEPGSPEASYLWLKLQDTHQAHGGSGTIMPPAGRLPASELDAIEAWIRGGAGAGSDTGDTDDGRCPPVAEPCVGECAAGPSSVTHAAWHNRLTESPDISWTPVAGAASYQVAIGTAPGADDAACWTDVGVATDHAFPAIWVLANGQTYLASVRAVFADGTVSEPTASTGWTVDIDPPDKPAMVDDARAPVDGTVHWAHPQSDSASGFAGFEVAVGTAPGSADTLPWTPAGTELTTVLGTDVAMPSLPPEAWYWLSVRATDLAGNASQPAISTGFITCPNHYSFVPSDPSLGTDPFCVATYEMRVQGLDDGDVTYSTTYVAESRPTGTPWSGIDKGQARVSCDSIGFSWQLITNPQWQAVARSIERTPGNWSGGAVGAGEIPRGHSDELPLSSLASDGDVCVGTGNPGCADPSSSDWSQRRTHQLSNGETIWDFSGNLKEQVDGSTGGPDGLWMSFDNSAFTTDDGWEAYRAGFGPEGDFTEAQGMGRLYGGTGNLTRGGSYDHASSGAAGSRGFDDTGIYNGHHNSWNTGITDGFRCVFVPM